MNALINHGAAAAPRATPRAPYDGDVRAGKPCATKSALPAIAVNLMTLNHAFPSAPLAEVPIRLYLYGPPARRLLVSRPSREGAGQMLPLVLQHFVL